MNQNHRSGQPMFSQIDVTHASAGYARPGFRPRGAADENTQLLRDILAAQDRQNELLEELITQVGATQRQRAAELGEWKHANPKLAQSCRQAAESLSKVQTEFLANLTNEIRDNYDAFCEGDFMLNEFVDRYGPRLAHLNGVLQVLSQLSSVPAQSNAPNSP